MLSSLRSGFFQIIPDLWGIVGHLGQKRTGGHVVAFGTGGIVFGYDATAYGRQMQWPTDCVCIIVHKIIGFIAFSGLRQSSKTAVVRDVIIVFIHTLSAA